MNAYHAGLLASRALAVFVLLSLTRVLQASSLFVDMERHSSPGATRIVQAVLIFEIAVHLVLIWWLWVRAASLARFVAGDTLYEEAEPSSATSYAAVTLGALGFLVMSLAIPGFVSVSYVYMLSEDPPRERLWQNIAPYAAQLLVGAALLGFRLPLARWISRA